MRRLLLISMFIFALASQAFCYEVTVHEKIADNAIAASNLEAYLRSHLNMLLSDGLGSRTVKEWIEKGSNWEDDNATMRWLNHFYDPTTGKGLNIGPAELGESSVRWGKNTTNNNEWDWAMARYDYYDALKSKDNNERSKYYSFVFRSLGQIIHLVHDLAVPAHVRNDPHGAPVINYDMYEADTKEKIDKGIPLKFDGYPAVDIAVFNNFDAFWINGGKGLAEFTNKNFLSRDTNFDDAAYSNYNYPIAIGEWTAKETVPDPFYNFFPTEVEVKYLQEYVTDNYRPESSAQISRLSAFSYFDFEMKKINKDKRVYSLNSKVHKEYSDFLIPRAVGYSAGLLNYFFRGTIEITPPNQYVYSIIDGSKPQVFTKIKAKLKNTSIQGKAPDGTTIYEDMLLGQIIAVAKYKKRTDYQPDLSNDPPAQGSTATTEFSYSVSVKKLWGRCYLRCVRLTGTR